MTRLTAILEDFGSSIEVSEVPQVSDETLESERLESFDKGYRAGWDDAIKAKAEDAERFAEGFAQNLQDLSFTYHEVHAQVLANLTPLFEEILQKMLPALARDTLGAHIADQLAQLSREIGAVQIEVVVAPGAGDQVTTLLNAASTSLPVTVTEAPSVAEGQAELRLGGRELSVDISGVAAQITEAVHSVLYDNAEVRSHG